MHGDFHTRALLVVVAVLLSLIAALSAALLAYATGGSGLQAVGWGAGTFLGSMTLILSMLTILLS
ncbi:hypothetical protein OHB35_15610 [Streptomyces phaeochromogenes]|uniref:Uncharacterized protein n=1 Tax=Streptomyces phaeochromogenes TaxID=1923 RepID=A0ABZ1H7M3_STRPH|nr:hypothetical protein [Streptomyces phaeochromogenes]WSD14557.1 hypothetical protein OHB35_15610 [Streptomyces phaeochromogenes]